MEHSKKLLILVLKLAFTVGAFVVLLRQLDLATFQTLFTALHWPWLVAAFLTLNAAQLSSALRMRYYYQQAGLSLTYGYSIAVYYMGMLFNHLLPGGIGGDGYKTYLLKRDRQFPVSTSLRLMISGRANGLLLLILIGLGFGAFSNALPLMLPDYYVYALLTAAALFTALCYSQISRLLLKETYRTQAGAAVYSFCVQALVALCAACLFQSLHATYPWLEAGHGPDYLMLFMVACFVSVLPISFGGAGLRELTFFYGAQFLGLHAEAGVAVALLYFACNLIASLIGAVCFLMGTQKISASSAR